MEINKEKLKRLIKEINMWMVREKVSTLDLPGINITTKRRDGNTTRLVDAAVQALFRGNICIVRDHNGFGATKSSNEYLLERIVERLRKEREEQEAIEAEKLRVRNERAELLRPYIIFIDNYNGLIEKPKDEFNEVFESVKLVAQKQWAKEKAEQEKKQQEEEARLKKEREERKALEDALEKERAEREAERKAKEKTAADEAKRLAELAKSGDVAILNDWFTKNFSDINKPNGELSPTGESIYQNIVAKFQGFQAWGTKMINE